MAEKLSKEERKAMLDSYVSENGVTRLPYQGKPLGYKMWEERQARRKSCNRSSSKAVRGKTPKQGFFKRGEGCV